jgi:hypothetical protein
LVERQCTVSGAQFGSTPRRIAARRRVYDPGILIHLQEKGVNAAYALRYSNLLWAMLLGALVFCHWPDAFTLTGSALVVASGLYIAKRN